VVNAQVVLTNSDNGRVYKTKTGANGAFSMIGVPDGQYDLTVIGEGGETLIQQKQPVGFGPTSSETTQILLDVTKDGVKPVDPKTVKDVKAPKMTKQQIKEEEAKVAAMNALIGQAQNAMRAQNWPEAEKALQQVLADDPNTTRWELYKALGDCQYRSNKLDDALKSFQKGMEVAQAVAAGTAPKDLRNPNPDPGRAKAGISQMLTTVGNVYLKQGKADEAISTFRKAAESDPNPAVAYYNLCAVEYNNGKYDDAAAACDKSIAANPAKAEAWYFKGASLKNAGKPGAPEALHKYLELDPNGPYAAAAKSLLPK
jgi:tetratricopeptide (TPR) repeat protein